MWFIVTSSLYSLSYDSYDSLQIIYNTRAYSSTVLYFSGKLG